MDWPDQMEIPASREILATLECQDEMDTQETLEVLELLERLVIEVFLVYLVPMATPEETELREALGTGEILA